MDGRYDMHIHLNHLPILENDPPETARTHDMCAREIMSREIVSLKPVMDVGELYDTGEDTTRTHSSEACTRSHTCAHSHSCELVCVFTHSCVF
jgi:hypothetical protein